MILRRWFQASALTLMTLGLLMQPTGATAQQTSRLWGKDGERWSPQSRLPDFSMAGYRRGAEAFRVPPSVVCIKDFGARGDGSTDDTAALHRAIAAGAGKVIEFPPGTYILNDIFEIDTSNMVLRGAGPDKTIFRFKRPMEKIRPRPSSTDGDQPTTGWSWGGGLFMVGNDRPPSKNVVKVSEDAQRGDTRIVVANAVYRPEDEIVLTLRDDEDKSLVRYLYRGNAGDIRGLNDWTCQQIFRVTAVEGNTLLLDRPLRFDIRPNWRPTVHTFRPTVTDVGIENLAFHFPPEQYQGHFREVGYNPVQFGDGAAHCWLRNLLIRNADSGPYVRGAFCTLTGIRLEADPQRVSDKGYTGHHGISLYGSDSLCTDFVVDTRFIHDLTVQSAIGCVFSKGKTVDLCMDHHRWAPYENLFTDIDGGRGTRLFASSGGGFRGHHTAAGATYWNIRADRSSPWPSRLGIEQINIVALPIEGPESLEAVGRWLEKIPPGEVIPADLHAAMRRKRLEAGR